MNKQQPEALRREYRATMPPEVLHLLELDVLACVASLEAQLEAVGAGGVGPLIACAGFSAADMATAAAQGFRDGVASVSAGSAPVAWKHDCAALLANDVELWVDACPHCGKPRMHATQAAHQSPSSAQREVSNG